MIDKWNKSKIKYIFKERSEKVSDRDFTPLSVTKKGITLQEDDIAFSDNHENRKRVKINDIALNSRSARKGSSGNSKYDGSVSTVNNVIYSDKLLPEFANYLFKTNYFVEEYYKNGKGIHDDLWSTKFEQMGDIIIPIPPEKEQVHIIERINKLVPKIDEKIENLKIIINLNKEKRRSLIHEKVTKGNHSNIELKKTDIFWFESIPKHWKIIKIKYVANLIVEKKITKINDVKISPEYVESETGKVFNFNSEHGTEGHEFKKNDILFNKLRVYLNKVFIADREGYSMGEMIVIRPKSIETQFLYYVLTSHKFIDYCNSFSNGVKVPRPSVDNIFDIKIPLPPKNEQYEISKILESEISELDNNIYNQLKIIELLEEKKMSIISEEVFKNKFDFKNELH